MYDRYEIGGVIVEARRQANCLDEVYNLRSYRCKHVRTEKKFVMSSQALDGSVLDRQYCCVLVYVGMFLK